MSIDREMIPMTVADVAVDPLTGLPSLWLCDERGGRRVAIHIGLGEVSAIAAGLGGVELERPLPHDLLKQVLGVADIELLHVELADSGEVPGRWRGLPESDREARSAAVMDDDLSDAHTGFIVLRPRGGAELRLTARAADAIALALRMDRPIFMAPSPAGRPRSPAPIAVLGPPRRPGTCSPLAPGHPRHLPHHHRSSYPPRRPRWRD